MSVGIKIVFQRCFSHHLFPRCAALVDGSCCLQMHVGVCLLDSISQPSAERTGKGVFPHLSLHELYVFYIKAISVRDRRAATLVLKQLAMSGFVTSFNPCFCAI